MHLVIVNLLFKKSVLEDGTLDNCANQPEGSLAHAVFVLLQAAGCIMKLPHAPSKDKNKFFSSVSKHKFHGSEASKLMIVWRPLMDLVFPRSKRAADPKLESQYAALCACWESWQNDVWPLIGNTDMDRTVKADLLQSKGLNFVKFWVDATGGTGNVYLHLLTKHLPDQVRPGTALSMPCDPWFLQLQSQESKHSWRKHVHLNRTNKHAPAKLLERAQQIEAYVRTNGVTVQAHGRNSGKCRTWQALVHSLLHDELVDYYDTAEVKAFQMEQRLARMRARHRGLVRTKAPLLSYVTEKGKQVFADKEVDEDFAEELVASEEERKSDEQSEASAPVEAEQSSSTFSATDEDED